MAQDMKVNALLHQEWDIDEKLTAGETLTKEEKNFYNEHLPTIKNYYGEKNEY